MYARALLFELPHIGIETKVNETRITVQRSLNCAIEELKSGNGHPGHFTAERFELHHRGIETVMCSLGCIYCQGLHSPILELKQKVRALY